MRVGRNRERESGVGERGRDRGMGEREWGGVRKIERGWEEWSGRERGGRERELVGERESRV